MKKQKPILGTSRIRSAITNPTFKTKFEAGKNGRNINDAAIMMDTTYL